MWQSVTTAPFDRDLELSVIDSTGEHALVFPCRRVLHGWVNSQTGSPVDVHPTHWRGWAGSVVGALIGECEQERVNIAEERVGDLRTIVQKLREGLVE